jgi:hypothetical protein
MDTLGNGVQGSSEDHVGWPVDEMKTPVFELFRAMFCNDMSTDAQEVFLSKLGVDTWPPATYTFSAWRYDHLDAVPASYVVCQQDQVLPPAWQRKFAETLRVSRILSIDAGHQAMNTRPAELAALLLAEASAVNVGGDAECGDGAVRRPTA